MSTPFDHEATIPEGEHPLLAGRYRVVRRLGAGGMGEVHLVEDLKLDGRHFAVKLLPSFLAANKRAIAGLKREALHAMELSHSHIVTVRGFEEMESGQPFLVMDYVDGQTLEEILLERERMSEAEVNRIFGPIAEALDYAHGRGVIHRDVKPSNIMIRQDGTPLIMDFGIAREAKETSTLVTGRESTSGTLPYMSPEQLRGKKPEASQDIYSLAATMWECLAGEPPFSRGDLRHQILEEEPEPTVELEGLGLTEPLLRGLSKRGEQRPKSCREFLGMDERSSAARYEATPAAAAEPSSSRPRSAADLADLESRVRILAAEAKSALEVGDPLPPSVVEDYARAGHFVDSAKENKAARLWSDAAAVLERAIDLYEAIRDARVVAERVREATEAMDKADRRLSVALQAHREVDHLPQAVEYGSHRKELERALLSARGSGDLDGVAKACQGIADLVSGYCVWLHSVKTGREKSMRLAPSIKKIDDELISLREKVQLDRVPRMEKYRAMRFELDEQIAEKLDAHDWDAVEDSMTKVHRLVSDHRDWYFDVAAAREAVVQRQAKIEWADVRLSGLASRRTFDLEAYEENRCQLDERLGKQIQDNDWVAARKTTDVIAGLISKAMEAAGRGSKYLDSIKEIRNEVSRIDEQRLKMAASLAEDPRFDSGIEGALARQSSMKKNMSKHLDSRNWVEAKQASITWLESAKDSYQLVERKYQVCWRDSISKRSKTSPRSTSSGSRQRKPSHHEARVGMDEASIGGAVMGILILAILIFAITKGCM